jgi:hypothetical protein
MDEWELLSLHPEKTRLIDSGDPVAHGNGRPYRDHSLLVFETEPDGGARFSPQSWDSAPHRHTNGDDDI